MYIRRPKLFSEASNAHNATNNFPQVFPEHTATMDSIRNDVTRQIWRPQWWDALFVMYSVYGELPIEKYAFVCSSDQVTATRGRLESFNSAKTRFPIGFCALPYDIFKVSYTPRSAKKTPFAILVLSHSQYQTIASYFQVSVPSRRPQELVKSMQHNVVHLSTHSPESNRRRTFAETTGDPTCIKHKWANSLEDHWLRLKHNSRQQIFVETTGGTNTRGTQHTEERVPQSLAECNSLGKA